MPDCSVAKLTVFQRMSGEIRRPRPHDRSCLHTLSLWGSQYDNCVKVMGIDAVIDRSRHQMRGEDNPVVRILWSRDPHSEEDSGKVDLGGGSANSSMAYRSGI